MATVVRLYRTRSSVVVADMSNTYRCSIRLGHWRGIAIRVHFLFLLFAISAAGLCVSNSVERIAGHLWWMVIGGCAVLFASVLAHELGHLSVARRVGLAPPQIVIGPLGGLSHWPAGPTAAYDVRWALGGLATSLFICVSCAAAIAIVQPEVHLRSLCFHWHPVWFDQGPAGLVQWLEMALWINWGVFWINLLPAYPLDGERLYRGIIRQLQPQASDRRIADSLFWFGVIVASAMVLTAVMLGRQETDSLFPTWVALVLLAIVVLVSVARGASRHEPHAATARQQTRQLRESSVHSTTSYRDNSSPYSEFRQAEWTDVQDASEAETADPEDWERQQDYVVDEILVRVHANGLDSLNDDERAVLLRASERYRSRIARRP